MANKDYFERRLLFGLLVLCFNTVLVTGTLYRNNLRRRGTHVCEETKHRSYKVSFKSSYVGYTTYNAKCGLFGWARCKRSRRKTIYYTRNVIRYTSDIHLRCCRGWRKNGDVCTTPICNRGCNNGGRCVAPNSCSCISGWEGSSCSQDINECYSDNGGCQQICINRVGRGNLCTCRRGYLTNNRDTRKCTDVNECNLGNVCKCGSGSNEECGAVCNNTVGSYRCSCGNGYQLEGSSTCIDINECAIRKGDCLHQCVNLPGSYRCVCRRGFRLVNDKCQDVNECENSNGYCEHICQNVIGRHRCKCRQGFRLDRNGRTCSDVDECSVFHGCDGQCHNVIGGYYCSCSKGYELAKNNRTCTDVDECVLRDIAGSNKTSSLADCQQKCINNQGSFTCACNEGFKLMYDKKRCQDVDECKQGHHLCEHNCLNTYGSYRCSCRTGFKLGANKRTCEGLPCEQIVSPRHGAMTCSGLVTNSSCTFSCSPGYNLIGSQSRTCQASSRWSGNRTSCEAKHCEQLVPRVAGQSISVPCFTSFGSKCHFGCGPGFFLKGDGQANCSLSSTGSVSWKIGQFVCEEIETCIPNPCSHGGNCSVVDEKRFTCDCEGTGYKGDQCQTGFITTPIFKKLRPKTKSSLLSVAARPVNKLRISLYSDKEITFEPSSSLDIESPSTRRDFTVEAEKPGIRTISYNVEGPSSADFDTPEQSVLFVAPKIPESESLYTKLFLLKKELPIGCEEHKTNALQCEVRFISTAPWTANPLATHGIVQIAQGNDVYLPLSLIGLSFEELQVSRSKVTETSITMTSSDKEIEISYSNSGSCSTKKAHPDNLLELMDADALAASFLQSFSKMTPKWLQFALGESSDIFDIENVFVNVANSPPLSLEHCSGFPVESTSSVAYFTPVINYNLFVGQDEVSLLADGKTCFLVNVCKPAVFVKLPKNPAIQLKNTLKVFRDMKQRGFDLRVNSIGVLGDVETKDTVIEGVFWNGTYLERTSSDSYNMWFNADVEWNMEIPGKIKLTLQMSGQSFVYYDNLNTLFDDRLTRPLKISVKGRISVTVTARSLGEDFTLKIKALKGIGKAFLGGTSDCKDNFQGISLTLDTSARNLFLNSPFAPYIRPMKGERVYLAIFMLVRGGKQDQVTNKREIRRTLTNLRFLVLQLEQALQDAKSFLPKEEVTLDKWLKSSEHFSELIREIRGVLFMTRNVDLQRLHHLSGDINSKMYNTHKIAELLKTSLASQAGNSAVADVIATVEDIQFGFPSSLKLPIDFGGPMVQLNFQGISFHVLTSLCFQRLCFDEIRARVEFLKERSCVSSPFPLSTFKVRGKASRILSLSPGKILTMFGGQTVDMVFESNSKRVAVLFEARLSLLGFSQFINVTMDETQLSFQADADIFRQFPTELSITAKIKPDHRWNSLVFSVNGKMLKSSLLPSLLENKIKKTIHALAEKAARSIRNAENAVYSAKRRTEEAKKQLAKKRNRLNIASKELTKKEFELTERRIAYSQAKLLLNSTLMRYIALKQRSACDLQNCSYIYTNSCMPKVCRKNHTVKYPVSNCTGGQKTITIDVIVQKEVKDFYWKPTFTTRRKGNCGSTGWLKNAFVGCDTYLEKRPGPKIKVSYTRLLNARESKEQSITVFECGKPTMKSVFSGFGRPYECCLTSNGKTAKVRVLDPQCVIHNTKCFQNMTELAEEIKFENYTLFENFQEMMRKGEMVTLAQLSVNKAQAKVDFESNQLELVSALHKQQEYAEDSVNISRVKSREELGLRLGEKMENLGVQSLVSVEGLSFSIAMTSTVKTLFPVVASLKTADGEDRTLVFPIDFNKLEFALTLGAKRIIETLYGTSGSRKKRSTLEDPRESVLEGLDLAQGQRTCLFAHKANVFFADIIESLEFIVRSTKELDKELMESIHDFDKLLDAPNGSQYSGDGIGESQPTARPSQQLRAAFYDVILSIKETQVNSSSRTPWNTTLEHWRGYLDVITQEKNFTQCSGTKDCVDYFFSTLEDLYEFESNPRAIEIGQLLQELKEIVDDLLKQNHPLHATEEIISRAKFVVNKSNDEIILCGLPPAILKSSPLKVFVLEGDSAELKCEARSTTEVDYLWTKNGRVIEDYKESTLVLQNVTVQGGGAYRCKVSNNRGHATSNVTMVVVHRKPTITEHPRDLQVLQGSETASMVCNCTGSPPPLTEWFFTPMENQSDQAASLNFTEPVLILRNLTLKDAGFYHCNVTNLHGRVQSRIAKLDVLRFAPGIPRVSVVMKFAQCAAGDFPEETTPNCSVIPSTRLNNSNAFNYTFQEIIREMNWSPGRIDAFMHDPSSDASISFVVSGYDPIIPNDGASRYLKAMDAFSLSQRRLGIDLQSLQSALKAGKIKYRWHDVAIVGKLGSLEATVLAQKCPVGKEPQKDGFLCTDCIPGSYGLPNGSCIPCPDGHYQPRYGSTECEGTPCKGSEIPLIDNFSLPISATELYRSGEHLIFNCKPGYKMKGNATVVCSNGKWTFDQFRCERTCTPPWVELNKHCYRAMAVSSGRWKDAFGICRSRWSNLAIIGSQIENDFVANLAQSQIHSTETTRMWLGLRKDTTKAVFKWGDGSRPENYTNWSPGEPNNVKGRELCTEMLVTGSYELHRWNDIDCEDRQPKTVTVCEKALLTTPHSEASP